MSIIAGIEEKIIKYLEEYNEVEGSDVLESRLAIRALMNITKPIDLDDEFYALQDTYLKRLLSFSQVINGTDLLEIEPKIALIEGDITLMKVDAIVNPTNDSLEGSYEPLDDDVCSAILSFAGLQVRRDCIELIYNQGESEKSGMCKVTKGYNLPCDFIFHTVPPVVLDEVTTDNKKDLANCYLNCLKRAEHCKSKTIAFPIILDKEGNYPYKEAVKLGVKTIRDYFMNKEDSIIEKVIFVLENGYELEVCEKIINNEENFKLVKKLNIKK